MFIRRLFWGLRSHRPMVLGEAAALVGWIILDEPEIKLGEDILVPDLAAWKRERFPVSEETNWISMAPDWVCEVLSPTTLRVDKIKKMPLYAQHGVTHFWLVDPLGQTLDVFRLESGRWALLASFAERPRYGRNLFRRQKLISATSGWSKGAIGQPIQSPGKQHISL